MIGTKLTLSRLAYEIVRDSITMANNTELEYVAFCDKENYRVNSDWSLQVRKVFPAINKAFARLAQYGKLPYFTEELTVKRDGNLNTYADISEVPYASIKNAYVMIYGGKGDWRNFEYRITNNGKTLYITSYCTSGTINIEYQKEIPNFSEDDIVAIEYEDGAIVDNNIDLSEEYGIDSIMFQIIKSYASALITSEIDQSKGSNDLIYAENLMADLETMKPNFSQKKIGQAIRMMR